MNDNSDPIEVEEHRLARVKAEKRAKLAEKLFIELLVSNNNKLGHISAADYAIESANIFFDTLEGSNNENE